MISPRTQKREKYSIQYLRIVISEQEMILFHLFLYVRCHTCQRVVFTSQLPAQGLQGFYCHSFHLNPILKIENAQLSCLCLSRFTERNMNAVTLDI